MRFGHEQLDVYRVAIEYVGWAYRFCQVLKGHRNAKQLLDRIVAMLTKLGRRGYSVKEEEAQYGTNAYESKTDIDSDSDPDPDSDPDSEENRGTLR